MLPIGDDKIHNARPAIFTWIFILINVAVFIYEITMPMPELEAFIRQFGVIPAEITQGENLLSLLTSMFLHGGWMHLIGNMLFLYVFGDNIEHRLGSFWFVVFYLLGGLAGSVAHILTDLQSTIPSIGASGAISAVLGAYLVMFPKSKVRLLVFLVFFITTVRINAFFFLFIWIGLQVVSGMASIGAATAQTAGVAYWAHIGGFVFGVLIGLIGLTGLFSRKN